MRFFFLFFVHTQPLVHRTKRDKKKQEKTEKIFLLLLPGRIFSRASLAFRDVRKRCSDVRLQLRRQFGDVGELFVFELDYSIEASHSRNQGEKHGIIHHHYHIYNGLIRVTMPTKTGTGQSSNVVQRTGRYIETLPRPRSPRLFHEHAIPQEQPLDELPSTECATRRYDAGTWRILRGVVHGRKKKKEK